MIWCEVNFPRNLADFIETEYGLLFYNQEIPTSHDANRIVFLSDQERQQLQEIFLKNYQKNRQVEDTYWHKWVVYHIVQAMNDLSGLPDYQKRMPSDLIKQVEQNLIHEIEEYCEKY